MSAELQPSERIKRAFDAAFQRYAAAPSSAEQEDEMSNLLHHLYRLACCRQFDGQQLALLRDSDDPDLQLVAALVKVRNKDTHVMAVLAEQQDRVPWYVTNLLCALFWSIDVAALATTERDGSDHLLRQYRVTELLDGREVLYTLRRGFDALWGQPSNEPHRE